MSKANGSPAWIWWCLVVLAALALRVYVAPLPYTPDESVYVQHAWNLAHGQLDLNDSSWYIHRIPVYLQTGALYALFGLNYWSTMAWPLAVAAIQVLLVMALARHIAGPGTDIVAGLLLAALPLDVIASLHLHADGAFGMLMTASVVTWWMAGPDLAPRRRWGLLAASGFVLALAVLIRPYAGILALFFVADLVLDRRRRVRDFLPLALGAAPVLAAYLAIYQVVTGNALYRVEVVSQTYSDGGLAEPARLLFYPRVVLHPTGPWGVHGWLVAAAAATLVALGPRRSDIRLFVWIGVIAAFLQFGSMSLDGWLPILKRARFLSPVSAGAVVLIAVAIARLAHALPSGRWRSRSVFAALSGVAVAACGLVGWGHLSDLKAVENARASAFRQAAGLIAEHEPLPVYADHWRTAIQLGPHVSFFGGRGFYFGDGDIERMQDGAFDSGGRLRYLGQADRSHDLGEALAIIDRSDGRGVEDLAAGRPVLLMQEAGLELYLIGHTQEEPAHDTGQR